MSAITLIPIEKDGTVEIEADCSCEPVRSVLRMTRELYEDAGFSPPWQGYLALRDSAIVGTCGFKGPPQNGIVEIAYFTFPGYEGQGIATGMAQWLIELATTTNDSVEVTAQTLFQRSASHRILEKLNFIPGPTLQHPEHGPVLVWQRERPVA